MMTPEYIAKLVASLRREAADAEEGASKDLISAGWQEGMRVIALKFTAAADAIEVLQQRLDNARGQLEDAYGTLDQQKFRRKDKT